MASKSRSLSDSEIKKSFRNHKYSVWKTPCALYLAKGNIYHFGKDVRYQDIIKTQEDDLKEVTTPKLKVEFYYLSTLYVGVINKSFFHSRKDFDKLSHDSVFKSFKFEEVEVKRLGDVQFTNAMKKFNCEITCNMEYYLSKREEIKKDFNYKLDEFQLGNEIYLKQLEKSLFFKLLIDIFGDEKDKKEEEEQTIIFRDFNMVLDIPHFRIATAERGDCYITFYFLLN